MALSCKQGEKTSEEFDEKKAMFVNYTVQIPANDSIKIRKECQIELLESFFQLQYPDYRYLIDYDKSDFTHPLTDIYKEGIYQGEKFYRPTLMALTDISDKLTIAKIGYFNPKGNGFSSISIIYNLLIVEEKGTFRITNMLKYNTRNWQKKITGKITYFAYPGYEFNEEKIQKMKGFNNEMAHFFEVDPMSFTYYISPTVKESMQIRGYDFQYRMFLSDQIGAITYPYDKIIFVGNNSEYYPHEVVHLYLDEYFPNSHQIINEGLATYFGGSKGLPFEQHIHNLKKHLKNNRFDIREKLYSTYYTINEKTSLMNTMGALLCDLTLKKCGEQGLRELLNSGKEDDDLSSELEKLFGIDMKNFNSFIQKELENYD